MSRSDNHLCGLTLYAETCSLKEGHAGPCADGTSERPALLRDRAALAARVEEARAKAFEEAADKFVVADPGGTSRIGTRDVERWLRGRAQEIRRAALASPSGGGACHFAAFGAYACTKDEGHVGEHVCPSGGGA